MLAGKAGLDTPWRMRAMARGVIRWNSPDLRLFLPTRALTSLNKSESAEEMLQGRGAPSWYTM